MNETPGTIAELQGIIDDSARRAGVALARNFIGGGWRMTAEEFVAFWEEGRMAAISTVSPRGRVHSVPLDPKLIDGKFHVPTFPDSRRLRDHRANARCSIVSWDGPYRAVIVYGEARLLDGDPSGSAGEVAAEQRYAAGDVLTVEVTPTRIYGIRPPPGHRRAAP